MVEEMKQPWKRDTNSKYSEIVKTVMGFSIASLLLPVLLTREFLGIDSKTPLINVLGSSIYWAWGLLSISVFCGIFFLYLSAKWLRIAWGKDAGIFFSKKTKESTIERSMEFVFWSCNITFVTGLFLTISFFVSYANGL